MKDTNVDAPSSLYPIKLIDVELSQPISDVGGLEHHISLKALVRYHGQPLGTIQLPISNGKVSASQVQEAIVKQCSWPIIRQGLIQRLKHPIPAEGLEPADFLPNVVSPKCDQQTLVTVAVCTRNRTQDLRLCLDSLDQLDYPHLDVVIIDNAPSDSSTQELITSEYSHMRYICEPRPGLDWARNRAIIEAKGDIIAYTDDDVVVDSGWVSAIVAAFEENPEVMAVTGLVYPYELETEAQVLFEVNGGFGRGFNRKWISMVEGSSWRWAILGTGNYGTGANMAYRRELFEHIGPFDPALDVGTVTNGGGDLEMFGRLLKEGFTLLYEPAALVRHRHRREYDKLKTQIANNGVGFCSYVVRSFLHYPDERVAFIKLGLWWLVLWCLRRVISSFVNGSTVPRDIILAEFWGSARGLGRYQKARRKAAEIEASFPSEPVYKTHHLVTKEPRRGQKKVGERWAVRHVELTDGVQDFNDSGFRDYSYIQVFVTCGRFVLGRMDVPNYYLPISAGRLRETLVEKFGLHLFDLDSNRGKQVVWAELQDAIKSYLGIPMGRTVNPEIELLPNDVPVSIVLATLDRPDELRISLRHIMAQETPRPVEVIVVDNNPSSGLTPPVVAEFPGVVLVNEKRRGLAYARNAGFIACTGHIAIATDDDVEVPPYWLERLVAPFVRQDVMIVTGNVLPKELDNSAQRSFEKYGGLGRGFTRFEVGDEWFKSFKWRGVHTWELGATANAAFRTTLFSHPKVGLMDEALGPGMPSGVGEDTYLFYKTLRAGYTLVYEPSAFVWHKHRRTMKALRKQLYNYSTGHVAYHLTTYLRDGDARGLLHIFVHLPRWRMIQMLWIVDDLLRGKLIRGYGRYPVSLTMVEIWGNLRGFWALWRSRQRVNREGRSGPYSPPHTAVIERQRYSSVDLGTNGSLTGLIQEQEII